MRAYLKLLRFQQIRGSSFKRYIIYALGEVLLIMSGVLAAIFLNQQTQNQKDQQLEVEILTGIRNNLLLDTADIQANIRGYEQSLVLDSIVVTHLINKRPYEHEFMRVFYMTGICDFQVALHKSYFEEIKNVGLDIVENSKLRIMINRLYEFDYLTLERIENNLPRFDTYEKMNDFVMSYLTLNPETTGRGTKYWRYYVPPDRYEELLFDREILGAYIFLMDHKRDMLTRFYKPTLEKVLTLIGEIEMELALLDQS